MGAPPPLEASFGRGNPEGIPYLYLSSDEETAFYEVKPYLKEYVTIGKFELLKNSKIIDLRTPNIGSPFKHGAKLERLLMDIILLRILGRELSKPLRHEKAQLAYLPTQYLCEFIKSNGYDGIIYQSSLLATGHNILLYLEENSTCIETKLHKATKIKIDIKPRTSTPKPI